MPVKIFFCDAREDEPLLNKLKTHLRPLQREGLIEVWYDRDISAGTEWESEIKERLNAAQIVLLLISPDFMNSDYCYGKEMQWALERHVKGEARVIPIILEYVYWQVEPLSKLQALPGDANPIVSASWHSQNEALYNVAEGIRKVVEKLTSYPSGATSLVVAKEIQREIESPKADTPAIQQVNKDTSFIWALPVENLALLRTLTGDTGGVWSVAISSDGQILVNGSDGGTIKIGDLPTGKEVRTLTNNNTFRVSSVAISSDGQILVSGGGDKTIKVWDLSTGGLVHTLTGHIGEVRSVAVSADGQTLVSGSSDRTIKVWRA